jgi:hypothetical protein
LLVYSTVPISQNKNRRKRNYYQAKDKDYRKTFQKALKEAIDGEVYNSNAGITNGYIFLNHYFSIRV